MSFSKKIKTLRSNNGYTQKELSKLLGIRQRSYQRLEYGDTSPSGLTLKKLCQQFPQYTLWLMTDSVDINSIKNQSIEINGRTIL
jgi:transcriptional regulator with XRE-family HTH domain